MFESTTRTRLSRLSKEVVDEGFGLNFNAFTQFYRGSEVAFALQQLSDFPHILAGKLGSIIEWKQ